MRTPQQCARYGHHWTDWGPFIPVAWPAALVSATSSPPTNEPIEAYRYRWCECGAGEQEAYAGGERETFSSHYTVP